MMTPVWITFLLATIVAPEAVVPETPPSLGIKRAHNVAEGEPQLNNVFDIGFPGETS
jgi:hypothetical protein